MIRRLLIANRGEIAAPHHPRVPRARRSRRVAVYSDADARAPHVARGRSRRRASDRRRPPTATSRFRRIIDAARASRRRRGPSRLRLPVGERRRSPRPATQAGLDLRRPARRRHRAHGIEDRGAAADAGGRRAGRARRDARRSVRRGHRGARSSASGFPALVKASAGGGGKGMRTRPRRGGDRRGRFRRRGAKRWRRSATARCTSSGSSTRPRHVEVQVFADDHGHVVHLFERECSVQRRHQKVIEESPSPALTPALRARMTDAAVARRARPRLPQRRHGRVPRRGRRRRRAVLLPRDEHAAAGRASGHRAGHRRRSRARAAARRRRRAAAVDAGRLIASAATRSKRASTPRIRRTGSCRRRAACCSTASRACPGVRVDSGVAEGDEVSVHYDPLLAKVIAHGGNARAGDRAARSRRCATSRSSASARTSPFLIARPRASDAFRRRRDRHRVSRSRRRGARRVDRRAADVVRAAIAAAAQRAATASPEPSGIRGDAAGLAARDRSRASATASIASNMTDGRIVYVPGRRRRWAFWNGASSRERDGAIDARDRRHAAQSLTAPMPATVIKVLVDAGDAVKKGDIAGRARSDEDGAAAPRARPTAS